MNAKDLAEAAATAAEDKLGTDIVLVDVGDILGIVGWFVIVTARNTRQVRAIAEAVEEDLFLGHDIKPAAVEGTDTNRWVLVDYGDVVVHIFDQESRDFYRLDKLYSDAPTVRR